MKLCLLFIVCASSVLAELQPASNPSHYYASPSGSSTGDGSSAKPWDLNTALNNASVIKPGDTLWLKAGIYKGAFTSTLSGSEQAPVRIKAVTNAFVSLEPSEPGKVDKRLVIKGSWTEFWNLDVNDPDPKRAYDWHPKAGQRVRGSTGISVMGKNNKVINSVIRGQTGIGLSGFDASTNFEAYGNLVYYNGQSKWDHGIYMGSPNDREKVFMDNIVFGNSSCGITVHGGEGVKSGYRLEGNVMFLNSFAYSSSGRNFDIAQGAPIERVTINDNYTYPGFGHDVLLDFSTGAGVAFFGNRFVGPIQKKHAAAEVTLDPIPANERMVTSVIVRANRYQPGRANVIVYNWEKLDAVAVNLSGVLTVGQSFKVVNAQNFYGPPVLRGTFNGRIVLLPMRGLKAERMVASALIPAELAPDRASGPEFAVFVVLSN